MYVCATCTFLAGMAPHTVLSWICALKDTTDVSLDYYGSDISKKTAGSTNLHQMKITGQPVHRANVASVHYY